MAYRGRLSNTLPGAGVGQDWPQLLWILLGELEISESLKVYDSMETKNIHTDVRGSCMVIRSLVLLLTGWTSSVNTVSGSVVYIVVLLNC